LHRPATRQVAVTTEHQPRSRLVPRRPRTQQPARQRPGIVSRARRSDRRNRRRHGSGRPRLSRHPL